MSLKIISISAWRKIEHDDKEHADYFERIVTRSDGVKVCQVGVQGDGIDGNWKKNDSPMRIHHQFIVKESFKVRPITQHERETALRMRGRGMGVKPSTVIVSLSQIPTFAASLTGDIDGGLGVYETEGK